MPKRRFLIEVECEDQERMDITRLERAVTEAAEGEAFKSKAADVDNLANGPEVTVTDVE